MDTEDLIEGERLHEVAEKHGFKPRTLTKWRSLGLLPRHVEQVGHRQAGKTYLYPPESVRQLERLIYWKQALGIQTPPHRIGWALWCDGFDIKFDLVEVLSEAVMQFSASSLPETLHRAFPIYRDELSKPSRIDEVVRSQMPEIAQEILRDFDAENWLERRSAKSDFEGLRERSVFERADVVEYLESHLDECRHELVAEWDRSLPLPPHMDLVWIVYGRLTGIPFLHVVQHLVAHPDPQAAALGNALQQILEDMS